MRVKKVIIIRMNPNFKRKEDFDMKKTEKLAAAFLLVVCSFACIYVETTDYQYHTYTRINENGEEEIIDTSKWSDNELYKQMADDFFAVKEKNDEMVGWLNIPELGYFPIPMGKDNQYYLTNNEYKKNTKYGTPFLNTGSEGTFKDIALIHGHHMKNGDMFGSLPKYMDEQFFQNNGSVTVFDGEKFYEYRPFSVFLYQDGAEEIKLNGMKPMEREVYLNSLKERSMCKIKDGEFSDLNKQVLMLSTCNYTFKDARLMVCFYLASETEYEGEI